MLILIAWGCSSGLEPDRIHSLREIKRSARHCQEIKSQGIVTEKTGKRDFIVSDNHVEMKINLRAFKKESKNLKQNTKIVFSGTFRRTLFAEPEIKVTYFQVVEDFK